jgi:hypothetical protein
VIKAYGRVEVADKLSWTDLLSPEEQVADRRWARLVVGAEAEVEREVRDLASKPPSGGADVWVVRGERCPNRESLFREWSRSLGFPDYFGNNWDAFNESLNEIALREGDAGTHEEMTHAGPEAVLVLVTHSAELLREEPESCFRTFVDILKGAALQLGWTEDLKPPLATLRFIFQCGPDEAEALRGRFKRAGLDL